MERKGEGDTLQKMSILTSRLVTPSVLKSDFSLIEWEIEPIISLVTTENSILSGYVLRNKAVLEVVGSIISWKKQIVTSVSRYLYFLENIKCKQLEEVTFSPCRQVSLLVFKKNMTPIPNAGLNNLWWWIFLAVVGEIELEKRLLVRALISPFSADDDNNNHSQEWQQMGKREHRRLFKEACTQLLSAIKTQISEDELEQKAHPHTHTHSQNGP